MKPGDEPLYIGDSVYVTFDGYQLRLYTDNGLGASNEIYLEPAVAGTLYRLIERTFMAKEPVA